MRATAGRTALASGLGRVEDGRGGLGHSASPRFPSPLIPDVKGWGAKGDLDLAKISAAAE
jgi:hypothetical protein